MSGSNSSVPASGAPEPLHLAVHSMAAPQLEPHIGADPKRTRAGRWRMLGVLAMCAAPVIASYFTYFVIRPQSRANYAELIQPMRELPRDLPLAALDGSKVEASSLRGQWLMVVVADAACDAACEQHLLTQRQLREALGRDRDRVDKLWLIPNEAPLRPQVLAVVNAAPSVTALRVPRAALVAWLQPAEGRALEDHLYLVDPMGQWMMRTPPDLDRSRFKRDLDKLLRASASWDTPGR